MGMTKSAKPTKKRRGFHHSTRMPIEYKNKMLISEPLNRVRLHLLVIQQARHRFFPGAFPVPLARDLPSYPSWPVKRLLVSPLRASRVHQVPG